MLLGRLSCMSGALEGSIEDTVIFHEGQLLIGLMICIGCYSLWTDTAE